MYFARRYLLIMLFSSLFSVISFAEETPSDPVDDANPVTEQADPPSESSANDFDKWPQPPSQTQLLSQDLTQTYLPENTIELDPDKQITVVVHQSQHSPTKGYVLVQPQWDSVPFDLRKTQMHKTLTRKGWHVITLLPQRKLILNGSPEEKAQQYEQYLTETAERLAAIAQLPETQSGHAVMIAEQNMAVTMLSLYRQQLSPLPDAIVLLAANQLSTSENQALANDLSGISIPVLDIFQTSPQQISPLQEVRAQAAQKSGKRSFRQLALTSSFIDEDIGKYINGWTKSLGY
ncbi:DUF3530 family protein [Motilimonas sp. KMU-193]|uniref:DUF3530 family protein n=1 Tax=Motilimonas sp. KMU-193 TaxID=3388668 RepID=UPI00396B2D1B